MCNLHDFPQWLHEGLCWVCLGMIWINLVMFNAFCIQILFELLWVEWQPIVSSVICRSSKVGVTIIKGFYDRICPGALTILAEWNHVNMSSRTGTSFVSGIALNKSTMTLSHAQFKLCTGCIRTLVVFLENFWHRWHCLTAFSIKTFSWGNQKWLHMHLFKLFIPGCPLWLALENAESHVSSRKIFSTCITKHSSKRSVHQIFSKMMLN